MSKGILKAIASRLFPAGTDGAGGFDVPSWPPDLFAFAATASEQLGIYSSYQFNAGWDATSFPFDDKHVARVEQLADEWNVQSTIPRPVQQAWSRLMSPRSKLRADWMTDVFFLLAVADEASAEVGFEPSASKVSGVARDVFSALIVEQSGRRSNLPHVPGSLCLHVPPHVVCVQPKTNTPKVGCTLRSASNHLALLPPQTQVATSWLYAAAQADTPHFNILLVPFPYRIESGDFRAVPSSVDPANSYFSTEQPWLTRSGFANGNTKLLRFISALIKEAEKECGVVHALVFPELALDGANIEQLARKLGSAHKKLEIFISGVRLPGAKVDRNCAFTARYIQGELAHRWVQPKHHRWKLDAAQIKQYSFGFTLDPKRDWWEQIDVADRSCAFSVVRPRTSIATLVCEDLARFDPVLPVINSIGPSLVVGLLMDGPQWEKRWPGRYATVLADDPGSSVLTLTSLGMIRRSTPAGTAVPQQIGLWKQPGSPAEQLTLPSGAHGLVLSLTTSEDPRQTLDRRRLQGRRLGLSGVQGVHLRAQRALTGVEFND